MLKLWKSRLYLRLPPRVVLTHSLLGQLLMSSLAHLFQAIPRLVDPTAM